MAKLKNMCKSMAFKMTKTINLWFANAQKLPKYQRLFSIIIVMHI